MFHSATRCLVLLFGALALFACATPPPADAPDTSERLRLRPIFDIEKVEVPIPGQLELRLDHKIGGYDAIFVRHGRLRYRHGSLELTRDAERTFLAMLERSLVTAIETSDVEVAETPGRCAMEVQMGVFEMDLETADYAEGLADMVVVMTFRDSVSGDALLRYARPARIDHPESGVSDDRQLRDGLSRIVVDMDVTNVLRPAGLATDATIEGCRGRLGERGREQNAALR